MISLVGCYIIRWNNANHIPFLLIRLQRRIHKILRQRLAEVGHLREIEIAGHQLVISSRLIIDQGIRLERPVVAVSHINTSII